MLRQDDYTYWTYKCEDIFTKAALLFKYYVRAAGEGPDNYIKVETDRELLQLHLEKVAQEVFEEFFIRFAKEITNAVYIGLFPMDEDIHLQFKTNLFLTKYHYLLPSIDTGIQSLLELKLCEKWAKSIKSESYDAVMSDILVQQANTKRLSLVLSTKEYVYTPTHL